MILCRCADMGPLLPVELVTYQGHPVRACCFRKIVLAGQARESSLSAATEAKLMSTIVNRA